MDAHPKYRPTTLAERNRFVWLWRNGLSSGAIAQKTGTSITTVCRWLRRWRLEGHVHTKPRRGRPRKEGLLGTISLHTEWNLLSNKRQRLRNFHWLNASEAKSGTMQWQHKHQSFLSSIFLSNMYRPLYSSSLSCCDLHLLRNK